MLINLDLIDGESGTYRVTRDVTVAGLAPDDLVYFREDHSIDGYAIVLMYLNGEPTKGNQYVTFPSLAAADRWLIEHGLVTVLDHQDHQ